MTVEKWKQLESLCREALDETTPDQRAHPTFKAVALCGAFAASVVSHMED
jgi:hypothetical protein